MAHVIPPYLPVSTLRSQLLTNPPSAVPGIDDLLSLEAELKALRNKSQSRVKKADHDLRNLESLQRKLKDKERDRDKGKIKDKSKVKRETTETPDAHLASGTSSTPIPSGGYGIKSLPASKSLPSKTVPSKSIPGSYSSHPSSVGNLIKEKLKKDKERALLLEKERKKEQKKKKRKREDEDSDIEEMERPKKLKRSPEPPVVPHKQKSPNKVHGSSSQQASQPATATSFILPRHIAHVPQRPGPQPLPAPGPSTPKEVTEDFSKLKPPTQTAITTFWSYLEPWLRPIREEDVGLLEWDGDEDTPFVTPPLGRHYTEIWDDEDNGRFTIAEPGTKPTPTTASLLRWDPLSLNDADLVSDKGHALGPVHERLLSAMLPVPMLSDRKPPGVGGTSRPTINGGGSRLIDPMAVDDKIGKMKPFEGDKQPPKVNVQDMQERIIKELKSIGLLGEEEPDYTNTSDDPVAAELRQCQKELRVQMVINKARRKRLAEIAKARLTRNEFEEHVGALERSILAKYKQLQQRDMPKQAKKKKKSGGAGGGAHVVQDGPVLPPPHIHAAAWGLEKNDDVVVGVDEELNNMILMRQKFVDLVQPVLDMKERERPGLLYGSPKETIYKDLDIPEVKVKGQ